MIIYDPHLPGLRSCYGVVFSAAIMLNGCALGLDLSGSPEDFYEVDGSSAPIADAGPSVDVDTVRDTGTSDPDVVERESVALNLGTNLCFNVDPPELDPLCRAGVDMIYADGTFRALGESVELCAIAGSFESIDEVPDPLPNCTSRPPSYRGFTGDAFVIGKPTGHFLVFIALSDGRGNARIEIQERD